MWIPSSKKDHKFMLYLSYTLLLLLTSCANIFGGVASSSTPIATPGIRKATLTVIPTTDPTATPDTLQKYMTKAQQLLAGMSLDEKLGQLIIVEYLGNNYSSSGLQYMIAQQEVGGFLYQAINRNFYPPDNVIGNVAAFSQQANRDARIPLLIGTDQEGGLVNRLYTFHGYLPSAAEMAATGNPQYAFNQGAMAAKWMLQLGINADLAPVVDVHTVNPPVLETRMFGSDPNTVVTYAGAYLEGLQQNSVIGCLKHFPGLGAITSDPHAGLPTVNRSLTELENIDLAPYRMLIAKDHPAMIMSTDVLMPAIDPNLPAELSPKAITGILRQQLGYNGVIITDGLYMGGIRERWPLAQAALLSIQAGDDLIEGPYTPGQVAAVLSTFKQAIQNGQLTIERINQSVERILVMKMEYGIMQA
jgi:beta-N-acetylhexosaminidase